MKVSKYQLVVLRHQRDLLRLEDVSLRTGVHPEILRRFIDLGLIEPTSRSSGMFEPEVVHRVAVIQRLRYDLGINLQGIGVILDLLDRLKARQSGGDRGFE